MATRIPRAGDTSAVRMPTYFCPGGKSRAKSSKAVGSMSKVAAKSDVEIIELEMTDSGEVVERDVWSGNPETDKAWRHNADMFGTYFPGIVY